jgi:hypothetical protein
MHTVGITMEANNQFAEQSAINTEAAQIASIEMTPFGRVDSADTYSSSSSHTSTRRSSFVALSFNDGRRQLSSRTSFSSLQSPDPKAVDSGIEDIQLQHICADEVQTSRFSSRPDPFAHFTCAFGFQGKLDGLSAIPTTKKAFLEAVKAEQRAVGFIQQGLAVYIAAINSGEHHTFSPDFLAHQNSAADTTVKQLDAIGHHLKEVIDEVNEIHPDDDNVQVN